MEVYDIFYQIMTELTPKDVGALVTTHKQANKYGLTALERYFNMCFQDVPSFLTVDYLKILHRRILRIRRTTILPVSWSYSPKETIRIIFDDENYELVKASLRGNNCFTKVIRDLNPLKLVRWDIDMIATNGETTEIICYVLFRHLGVRKDNAFVIFHKCY